MKLWLDHWYISDHPWSWLTYVNPPSKTSFLQLPVYFWNSVFENNLRGSLAAGPIVGPKDWSAWPGAVLMQSYFWLDIFQCSRCMFRCFLCSFRVANCSGYLCYLLMSVALVAICGASWTFRERFVFLVRTSDGTMLHVKEEPLRPKFVFRKPNFAGCYRSVKMERTRRVWVR
jgi:hypothetical protein